MEDRHQPLPPVTALPAWAWRKLGRLGRIAVVALGIALLVTIALLAPRIAGIRRDNAARDRRELIRAQTLDRARRVADQRVHRARSPARTLPAVTRDLERAIDRDLAARLRARTIPGPPVRRVSCGPLPEDPRPRGGLARLKCLAVTSETDRVLIGFELVAGVRPRSGAMAWCKTNPAAGEKANGAQLSEVRLSAACFGGARPGERQAPIPGA